MRRDVGQENLPESEPINQEVQVESFRRDNGEIAGVRITCKCGEVVDLEFSYEDVEADEDLSASEYEAQEPADDSPQPEDQFQNFTDELPDEDGASLV